MLCVVVLPVGRSVVLVSRRVCLLRKRSVLESEEGIIVYSIYLRLRGPCYNALSPARGPRHLLSYNLRLPAILGHNSSGATVWTLAAAAEEPTKKLLSS